MKYNYLKIVKEFEQWSLSHYLPAVAELLWYKLMYLWEKNEWADTFVVENQQLLQLLHIKNENSLIHYRQLLIKEKLLSYERGVKGSPGRYQLRPENLKPPSVPRREISDEEKSALIAQFGTSVVKKKLSNAEKYTGCLTFDILYEWCLEEQKKSQKDSSGQSNNRFNNFPQRKYDFEEYEKQLLDRT